MRRSLARALAMIAVLPGSAAMAAPMHVMSLNECTDQLVLALLPPQRIASVTWLSRDATTSTMARSAGHVPVNHGSAEEVVRQKPDLVIAGTFTTPATRALLQRLNYPVIELGATDSFDAIRQQTRQLAIVLGVPKRGDALVAHMDATLAELRRKPGAAIRVAAWDGAGFSAAPGTLYDAILRAAGARNVIATTGITHGAPDIETLLTLAPPLLVRGEPAADTQGTRRNLAFHPLVRRYWSDRTVTVPAAAYICGTPFSADAALALRDQLSAAIGRARAPLPFAAGAAGL